tara:strand:+ start:1845 stop:2096 length:252 start_codon:yes stop_codon:yes gene_type:complete
MKTETRLYTSTRKLLDEKEASLIIGAATPTLRKSRCTGELFGLPAPKYLKLGRTIRYQASVLNDWLESLEGYSIQPIGSKNDD